MFCNILQNKTEKKACLSRLYSFPDVANVKISESDSLHIFGNYYDIEIILKNGDSFSIGDLKSDLSFDNSTNLYSMNKTDLFSNVNKKFSLYIPLWILSDAYGKQIDDFYIFYKNYPKIADFLNDENISTKKFKTRKGLEFNIGRHNDKKI